MGDFGAPLGEGLAQQFTATLAPHDQHPLPRLKVFVASFEQTVLDRTNHLYLGLQQARLGAQRHAHQYAFHDIPPFVAQRVMTQR